MLFHDMMLNVGVSGGKILLVNSAVSTTTGSITLPSGALPNDIVIIGVTSGSAATTVADVSGYTTIVSDATNTPISQSGCSTFIGYKIMPNPVDTTASFTTPTSFACAFALIFRNVSTTTPLDGVAPTANTQQLQANPVCPAITTSTSGAWVIRTGYQDGHDYTATAPTGYTLIFSNNSLSVAGATVMAAYKLVNSPSTETQSDFGGASTVNETFGCSFVLRSQ